MVAHVVGVDVLVHVLADLVADQADVATEVFRREAKLDKLFLLHQDMVRHVVHDLGSKDAVLFPLAKSAGVSDTKHVFFPRPDRLTEWSSGCMPLRR